MTALPLVITIREKLLARGWGNGAAIRTAAAIVRWRFGTPEDRRAIADDARAREQLAESLRNYTRPGKRPR